MAKKDNPYSTAFSAGFLLFKESEAIINNIQDPDAIIRDEEKVGKNVILINYETSC